MRAAQCRVGAPTWWFVMFVASGFPRFDGLSSLLTRCFFPRTMFPVSASVGNKTNRRSGPRRYPTDMIYLLDPVVRHGGYYGGSNEDCSSGLHP
jgi:hypothetical protein